MSTIMIRCIMMSQSIRAITISLLTVTHVWGGVSFSEREKSVGSFIGRYDRFGAWRNGLRQNQGELVSYRYYQVLRSDVRRGSPEMDR
jgi:hypothetical protein